MQPPEVQGSSRTKEPSKPKPTLPNPSPTPRYVVPACKRGRTALGALLAFDNLGQDEAAAAGGPLRSTRLELSERIPSTAARLPPLKREGARPRRVSVALAPKAGPGQQPRGSERARPGPPVERARRAPSAAPRRQVAPADQERAAAAAAQVPLPAGLPRARATAGRFSFVFLFLFFSLVSSSGNLAVGTKLSVSRARRFQPHHPGPLSTAHPGSRVGVSSHPTPRTVSPLLHHPGGTARRRGPPPREMLWYGA